MKRPEKKVRKARQRSHQHIQDRYFATVVRIRFKLLLFKFWNLIFTHENGNINAKLLDDA